MTSSKTYVITVNPEIANKLHADLNAQGFEFTVPPHTIFSAKKTGISCTLYLSGKLVVQGRQANDFIEFYLEPEVLGTFEHTHAALGLDQTDRIGIDESGKGDFFGPLCVAGVYASGEGVLRLHAIGVKDSKALSDQTIRNLAPKIRAEYTHHILKLLPSTYNDLYSKFRNLNHLLAWGHATAIEELVTKTGCVNVIIDQFAASESTVVSALKRKHNHHLINLHQRHGAEEDLVVAAASIIARETFLEALDRLSEEFGIRLPKGASSATIEAGRTLVKRYGPEILNQLGKMHFKTAQVILEPTS